MPEVRSIRLFLWLPLMVILAVLLVDSLGFMLTYQHTREQIWNTQRQSARQLVSQLSSILSTHDQDTRSDTIADYIPVVALNTHIRNLLVINPDGKVLYSNHLADEGQQIESLHPEWFDTVAYNRSLQGHDVVDEITKAGLIYYYTALPMGIEQGDIRNIKNGVLVIKYDLNHDLRQAFAAAASDHAYVLVLLVMMGALLFFIMQWFLVGPLKRIISATSELGKGDFRQRLNVSGGGELANLANSFNQMTERLEINWNELQQRRKFLQTTLQSIGDGVIVTDQDGNVVQLNPVAESLTGWSQKEAKGKSLQKVFRIYDASSGKEADNPVDKVIREGRTVGLANNTMLISRTGESFQIADSAAPIRMDPASRLLGVILVFRDVSAAYSLQAELHEQLDRLDSFTRTLPDLGFIIAEDGTYLEVLGGDESLLYQQRDQLLGKKIHEILPPDTATPILECIRDAISTGETQQLEFSLNLSMGERWFEGRTSAMKGLYQGNKAVVWLSRDITSNKQNEQKIYQLAYYDELTGLLNRTAFLERLREEISRCDRQKVYGAMMFVDLDHFKDVNDSLGHDTGDELLKQVAQRCRRILRVEDILARMAGDEFIIFLTSLGASEELAVADAQIVAEKLLEEMNKPFRVGEHYLRISGSIGITLYPQPEAINIAALMKQADGAMYRAKDKGRNCISFFDQADQNQVDRRFRILQDLPIALERGEVQLYLQPIVDQQGRCIKAEALMRWHHPELGWVSPGEFIPIAESTGLVLKLGAWAIKEGARLYQQVASSLRTDSFKRIAINLSPAQFQQEDFVDTVMTTLQQNQLSGDVFEFELTEEILVSKPEIVRRSLECLRDQGVHFSIDDFGTGYSSLQYLTQLPLNSLKIDRSFIRDIYEDPRDAAIVTTVISMANSLGIAVVAEGVENDQQLAFLKQRHCDYYQGYYFSAPVPVEKFIQFLQDTVEISS